MEEIYVLLLNYFSKYTDKDLIENKIKLNYYHYYISSLFIKSNQRSKLLSILYLDLELNKILKFNTEKNILIIKFDWWRIACSKSIEGKDFSVPILRLLKKLFYNNHNLKDKLINLIDLFQQYSLEKNDKFKLKYYYKYLVLKNNIITSLLEILISDSRTNKALRLAIISKTYDKFNINKESNFCMNKAKYLCKKPKREYLILFLLNSSFRFNKRYIVKQLFYSKLRYW
jgi:hypothetical protein